MDAKISYFLETFQIPSSRILNMNEVGVRILEARESTWTRRGAKQVPLVGLGDKQQFTICPLISLDGQMIMTPIIWQGKTSRVLPPEVIIKKYPTLVHHYSESHWQTHSWTKMHGRAAI